MTVTTPSEQTHQHGEVPFASTTRVFVVGDVHLDGSDSAFPQFLDELAKRRPARLIILGDLFEYWLETPTMVILHKPVLDRLKKLATNGWQLDLILGNREFAAGSMLAAASSCQLHWPALDLNFGKRRIRIVHGDRLCYDPNYRLFAAIMRSFIWRAFYVALPGFILNKIALMLRKRSRSIQKKRYEKPTGSRKSVFIDRRKVQGAARECDTLIAGHIHESWRRTVGGVDMLLVGDWPEQTGHWIEIDNLGTISRHKRQF